MGLCAPAVVAAHAALESSAADDRLIVVPGQLVKVAGVFQFMGRVGQRREGHAVPCKADAYIQSAAGDSCTVHAGAAAALLRVRIGKRTKSVRQFCSVCVDFLPQLCYNTSRRGGYPFC